MPDYVVDVVAPHTGAVVLTALALGLALTLAAFLVTYALRLTELVTTHKRQRNASPAAKAALAVLTAYGQLEPEDDEVEAEVVAYLSLAEAALESGERLDAWTAAAQAGGLCLHLMLRAVGEGDDDG